MSVQTSDNGGTAWNRTAFRDLVLKITAETYNVPVSRVHPLTRLSLQHEHIETAIGLQVGERIGAFGPTSQIQDVVEQYANYFDWR